MQGSVVHIPQELFAPAEYRHFEGAYTREILISGPDIYSFTAPISWQVDITNTGDAFLISGTADCDVRTACARCLEPAEYQLICEVEGYFLIQDSESPEDMNPDEFDMLPDSHDIDLDPLVDQALRLELPYVPLCQDDCKGLCPVCGSNLNNGPCGCTEEDLNRENREFEEASNPFAVLKSLQLENAEDK